MDQCFYRTGQFARKASVSVRTLRYYDKVGLLSPSYRTETGHRLYTDADLMWLKEILALKFLGFPLDEIKQFQHIEPTKLQESLALQRVTMLAKRSQIDTIIRVLNETEELLRASVDEKKNIVHMIQVIQMQQVNDWFKDNFTEENAAKMREFSKNYFTEEQLEKLRVWTEEYNVQNAQVIEQKRNENFAALKRMIAEGEGPDSLAAQALAKDFADTLVQITHGDRDLLKGMRNMFMSLSTLPEDKLPVASPVSKEEGEFMRKALQIYSESQNVTL